MKILAIETSCDETAISIIKADEGSFDVLSHVVHSQIDIHKEYGGVFPALAKREHGLNLVPVLTESLRKAELFVEAQHLDIPPEIVESLAKNPELQESFKASMESIGKPDIDYIAVTEGPGLEPALWAGISFAEALGKLWNLPVVPVNHMEGHIASVLLSKTEANSNTQITKNKGVQFPALALLVSGGHTELVLADNWGKYTILGKTLDDAAGEAFDKVARLMDLPYPGGPEISKRATQHREQAKESSRFSLPRPMMHSKDLNFSFSGLKTAVRYALEKEDEITEETCLQMSREFEDAVVETLVKKVIDALEMHPVRSFVLAGGVSANIYLQTQLQKNIEQRYPQISYLVPEQHLSTDNATMIALAAYTRIQAGDIPKRDIVARGNLRIDA